MTNMTSLSSQWHLKIKPGKMEEMVIVFCGIPGSGKSTIARMLKEELEKFGQTKIFISDKVSGKVYRKISKWLKENLGKADYILIDATFYKKEWRDQILTLVGKEAVLIVYLYCKLETCLERNKKRESSLQKRVIYIINSQMERPENPDLSINTDEIQPGEAVCQILAKMKTRKQNKHFSNFARQIVKNYVSRGKWTPEELKVKDCLLFLGYKFEKDFFHNFKIKQPSGYFWLDFFFPRLNLIIEINSFWHRLGKGSERDKRKLLYLKDKGFKVVKLNVKDIHKLSSDVLRESLKEFLQR